MQRRDALKLAVFGAGAMALGKSDFAYPSSGSASHPIIDAHIHLFDTSRPGGVPWPTKDDAVVFKPALPDRYEAMAAPFGIVGAIAIEASSLASDNQWLLDVASKHPVIVGVIGDLVPGTPTFLNDLDRLHAQPLFRGFRYGNLWDRNLEVDLDKPGFVEGLKALSQAGLVFESANPDPTLIRAIVRVSERVPGLRIVIDHLPHAPIPTERALREEYQANLRRLADSPGVFVKLSEIPVKVDGSLVKAADYYRGPLDAIWEVFGEDRIFFGSDWPNSDHVASFAETFAIVHEYISRKPPAPREKYYWKNSQAAYQWRKRRPDQPSQ